MDTDVEDPINKARALLAQGMLDAALQVIASFGRNTEAWKNLVVDMIVAADLCAAGPRTPSAEIAKTAAAIFPFDIAILNMLSDLCASSNDTPGAIGYAQRSLTLNFQQGPRHLRLARLHERQGAVEIARYHASLAVAFDSSTSTEAYAYLIRLLRNGGLHDQADAYTLLALSKLDTGDPIVFLPRDGEAGSAVDFDMALKRRETRNRVSATDLGRAGWSAIIKKIFGADEIEAEQKSFFLKKILLLRAIDAGWLDSSSDLWSGFPRTASAIAGLSHFCRSTGAWVTLRSLAEWALREDASLDFMIVLHAEACRWSLNAAVWPLTWPIAEFLRSHLERRIEAIAEEPRAVVERPVQKIAIIMNSLMGTPTYSVLRLILDYAVGLASGGADRTIFLISTDEIIIGVDRSANYAAVHDGIIREYTSDPSVLARLHFVCFDPPDREGGYAMKIIQGIKALDPDVVLTFHGFANNSFVFSRFLYAFFPLVYHQTNRLQNPDLEADVYLSNGNNLDYVGQGVRHPERWRHQRLGFTPFKKIRSYTKEELGVSQEAIVLVTVGNRLAAEIQSNFARIIVDCLATHAATEWLIVGVRSLSIEDIVGERLPESILERIHFREFEPDLRAMYENVDIYVNPFRAGGGTSIVLGIAEGVPVVCLAGSDVENSLDLNFVMPDVEAYRTLLDRLVTQRDARLETGERMRRRLESMFGIGECSAMLFGALSDARKAFMERKLSEMVAH